MRAASLFTGIGGFDLGFQLAGLEPAFMCELDQQCQTVLKKHFQGVPIYDDVRNLDGTSLPNVDVLTGGFPCQDVSVAGNRKGLAGERSGLWFEFYRIIGELKPQFVVIENVPGLLSSHKGRDFGVVLQGLVELGYGVCWRILDSQYFGVAQRRRRVFIVGSLGDGRAAEVLFESQSGKWDSPPSREKGTDIAAPIVERIGKGGFTDPVNDNIIAYDARHNTLLEEVSSTVVSKKTGGYSLNQLPVVAISGQDVTATLRGFGHGWQGQHNTTNSIGVWEMSHASEAVRTSEEVVPTLQRRMGTGGNQVPLYGVRRLTPEECEVLQGFPKGWTDGQSDSARYRQLGNAVTVSVAEWLGNRMANVCAT